MKLHYFDWLIHINIKLFSKCIHSGFFSIHLYSITSKREKKYKERFKILNLPIPTTQISANNEIPLFSTTFVKFPSDPRNSVAWQL